MNFRPGKDNKADRPNNIMAAFAAQLSPEDMRSVAAFYANQKLVPETAKDKASVLSFYVGDVHPHDVGTLLNQEGVAVRTGHHCAQPLMQRFGVPDTARASFAFYNTFGEVEALAAAVRKVQKMFA